MLKHLISSGLALSSLFILSGCSAKATPSYHKTAAQFESESTTTKKAPKARKAHSHAPKKTSSATKTQLKSFKVPKKSQHDKNYIKSGQLTKRHQYTYDQAGTKVSLAARQTTAKTFTNGHVSFKFTQIRVLKNQPDTKTALKMANQALNTDKIHGTYYTLQLKYTVTNHRTETVNIDGITALKTDQGQTLTPATQMYDAGAGTQLAAGAHKARFTMALITTQPTQIKHVKVVLGGIFTPTGKTLAKASSAKTLTLD